MGGCSLVTKSTSCICVGLKSRSTSVQIKLTAAPKWSNKRIANIDQMNEGINKFIVNILASK